MSGYSLLWIWGRGIDAPLSTQNFPGASLSVCTVTVSAGSIVRTQLPAVLKPQLGWLLPGLEGVELVFLQGRQVVVDHSVVSLVRTDGQNHVTHCCIYLVDPKGNNFII